MAGSDSPCSSARSRTHWATVRFFGMLGVFDLIGAAALIVLIGDERDAERFSAA
ncbi:MAG: hypothetical protein JO223_20500 [Hyphomicrobiales bacterium]|nr:hypothetical protein [Hyphomicrobiales bacterium]